MNKLSVKGGALSACLLYQSWLHQIDIWLGKKRKEEESGYVILPTRLRENRGVGGSNAERREAGCVVATI